MNDSNTPKISEAARSYIENSFGEHATGLSLTDPEFTERFYNFAFDEVIGADDMDDKTRFMAILATLLGCSGVDEFSLAMRGALEVGVLPVEVREIVYQSVAYLGIGRVRPFFTAMNDVFEARGIDLPLENTARTTCDNRLEEGSKAQAEIFGEQMLDFWKNGNPEYPHINKWLADNCFGDYYTRDALDLKQREMITFCFISAQGGCEPQLIAHAKGNMNIGNDKAFLIKVVSQCLPYIGYPRSLNAISCIEKAASEG